MSTPFVSVIMPVRNESAYIERGVNSVLAQDYPKDRMEIIVADGMSTDGTREKIKEIQKKYSNVRMIDNPAGIVSPGLNEGFRQSAGEVIVRVDGHCEIAPDYVSRCVSYLLKGTADGVGGPIETVGETYVARAIAAAMSSNFGVGGSAFRVGTAGAKFVDTVAFPAYRRETLEKAGFYDETLVRNQDDEYNYRLRKMGFKLLLAPDIRSRYYSRASFKKLWSQYFQYGYWKVRVLRKHPRQMSARQFAPFLFVSGIILASAVSLLVQNPLFFQALIGAYLTVSILASLKLSMKAGMKYFPVLPVIFLILHSSYGLGFWKGLLHFKSGGAR